MRPTTTIRAVRARRVGQGAPPTVARARPFVSRTARTEVRGPANSTTLPPAPGCTSSRDRGGAGVQWLVLTTDDCIVWDAAATRYVYSGRVGAEPPLNGHDYHITQHAFLRWHANSTTHSGQLPLEYAPPTHKARNINLILLNSCHQSYNTNCHTEQNTYILVYTSTCNCAVTLLRHSTSSSPHLRPDDLRN